MRCEALGPQGRAAEGQQGTRGRCPLRALRATADIHQERPDWYLFRDGCPGGESVEAVGARADHVVARLRALDGDVLVFSHGHFLRVLAARWLGLPAGDARYFVLSTAALSILGYEHTPDEPAIRLWNDNRHAVQEPIEPCPVQ